MEKRYKILRFVATLWKVLAWVILVLGLLGSIASLVGTLLGGTQIFQNLGQGLPIGPVVMGVFAFVAGTLFSVLYFLLFYALGEMIHLFLGIEENTRATAVLLQQLRPAAPSQGYARPYTPTPSPSTPPPAQQGNYNPM